MKSSIFFLFTLSFFYLQAQEFGLINTMNHNKLYAQSDVFVEHAKSAYSAYKQNNLFAGVRVGYEHLKPQSVYFASDLLYARGYVNQTDSDGYSFSGLGANFFNLETRTGYLFQSNINSVGGIIPFLGTGWFSGKLRGWRKSFSWLYAVGGVKMDQRLRKNFTIGSCLKAMYSFSGDAKNFWGYEAALPLTWHMNIIDFQVEPYYLKQNENWIQNILGVRLSARGDF